LSGYSWKDFTKDAKDPAFVGFVFWVFLSSVGVLWPVVWSFVFAIMTGFVLFDLIFGFFVKGKTIPISGNHLFKPKGWLFGAYLLGIGIASIASTLLSQGIADSLTRDPTGRFLTVIPNGFLIFPSLGRFSEENLAQVKLAANMAPDIEAKTKNGLSFRSHATNPARLEPPKMARNAISRGANRLATDCLQLLEQSERRQNRLCWSRPDR